MACSLSILEARALIGAGSLRMGENRFSDPGIMKTDIITRETEDASEKLKLYVGQEIEVESSFRDHGFGEPYVRTETAKLAFPPGRESFYVQPIGSESVHVQYWKRTFHDGMMQEISRIKDSEGNLLYEKKLPAKS